MKYRIKITTYQNGRKEYSAYVRLFFGWSGLDSDGNTGFTYRVDSRETALRFIDKHYTGNSKKQTIEFEYINK